MNDHQIALHGLYLALFSAKNRMPDLFSDNQLTAVFTAMMGARKGAWRVIGITPAALKLLGENKFIKGKHSIARGHLVDRIATVRKLFNRDNPYEIEEFYSVFSEGDKTVLMTYQENGVGRQFPDYIDIDEKNPNGDLFKCMSVGFRFGLVEKDFLKSLHDKYYSTPTRITP
jgi:hypothetical protein